MGDMKYSIERHTYEIPKRDDLKSALQGILHEYDFDYMTVAESEQLMEKEEAESLMSDKQSSIEIKEDGSCEVVIWILIHGEPVVDEDILEDEGEEVYVLMDYWTDAASPFDESSKKIVEDLGIDPEINI